MVRLPHLEELRGYVALCEEHYWAGHQWVSSTDAPLRAGRNAAQAEMDAHIVKHHPSMPRESS